LNTPISDKPKAKKSPQDLHLPDELLKRVDAYAARLESEIQINVSRSDAIRRLLVLGLEDALKEPGEIKLLAAKAEYGLGDCPEAVSQKSIRYPAKARQDKGYRCAG
jgi:hypothetical protein